MPSRSLFGILHFSLGSLSTCLCLAVLSVIPDAPYFPNPFSLLFAFQTIASSLALLVVTVPMACVIAMDQPHFLHPKFIEIPGHLFTFFLFFILSTQLCITLRRIIRTWSEITVDACFLQFHLLHVQLAFSTIFSLVATVFLSKRNCISFFNHSLMAWRINKMDWYITCGFSAVFASVLILLNLPTLRLMLARKALDKVVDLDEEDPLSKWRQSFYSLIRHLVADAIMLVLFCYPLPISLSGYPEGSSSLLPALSLLRSIGCPLWPVLSTVYCSNTLRDVSYRTTCLTTAPFQSIIQRFYTIQSSRSTIAGPPAHGHHGGIKMMGV
ncbi:hypothetical protein PENTCL1PPCAC_2764 [Pristionchus entomophagus]|uniref:7TM GPCR serpentine receptor class x (Srx) domain-containing protein n=1 Tax=Pristionchus entomophagus TaxID=358040 RepID=A0AAV5SKJ0_9BILA|nr:hypothetical protein PENTCL1PPCAC_2764 [Pristionchus entomophagus]